jgi:hypothetical protein
MYKVIKYTQLQKEQWDAFVDDSKNGTFILKRDYMDYHSDRFVDYSLMFYNDDKLVALLPASLHEQELRSHGGLTYGGIIMGRSMTVQSMLHIVQLLKQYLVENALKRLIYKRIPSIYYTYPSDEDLYALFREGSQLIRRDVTSTIFQSDKIRFSERRRRGVKKAQKYGIFVKESNDYELYMSLVAEVLKIHHNAKPVHTAAEMSLLASKFPENIKLFAAYTDDKMLAGVIVYLTQNVVHTQYIANSEEGRQCGALDIVMDYLVNQQYKDIEYFDFGTSMESEGYMLNEGLISQKQEFGGRAIVHDFYELKI